MGDRANIIVQQEDNGRIYLYTHWLGYRIREILAAALHRGRDRWDDAPYLTRIIFSEMLDGSELKSNTGFGISTTHCEPGNDLWVDTNNQTVTYNNHEYSYDEFIAEVGLHE